MAADSFGHKIDDVDDLTLVGKGNFAIDFVLQESQQLLQLERRDGVAAQRLQQGEELRHTLLGQALEGLQRLDDLLLTIV